jgi:hypothetical protein
MIIIRGSEMDKWDKARKYIASGGRASWPRDMFESYLDRIAELEKALREYGAHKGNCGVLYDYSHGGEPKYEVDYCTCGFEQTIKGE